MDMSLHIFKANPYALFDNSKEIKVAGESIYTSSRAYLSYEYSSWDL